MKKNSVFTRILAIVGIVLTWFPIFVAILIFVTVIFRDHEFHFDYLMPLELFFVSLAGGCLLVLASLISRSYQRLVLWGFALVIALRILVEANVYIRAAISDGNEPAEWMNTLIVIVCNVYTVSVVFLGFAGVLLATNLFRQPKKA